MSWRLEVEKNMRIYGGFLLCRLSNNWCYYKGNFCNYKLLRIFVKSSPPYSCSFATGDCVIAMEDNMECVTEQN
jgi:hypothetical protein